MKKDGEKEGDSSVNSVQFPLFSSLYQSTLEPATEKKSKSFYTRNFKEVHMTYKIFVSYSRLDSIVRRAITAELENIPGIKIIWDKGQISPGKPIHLTISDLIDTCDCVIPILTKESVKAHEVVEELTITNERKKTIVPFAVEELESKEVPHFLRDLLQIRYNLSNFDEKMDELKDTIIKESGVDYSKDIVSTTFISHGDEIIGGKLGDAIENRSHFEDFVLSLVGENELVKQRELIGYLTGALNSGKKKIPSGFSYWGIGPTNAWVHACNDDFYIMKKSIDAFSDMWKGITKELPNIPYHYVSLGVGTGSKDITILRSLSKTNSRLHYFPVDMSPEMLRHGVLAVQNDESLNFKRNQILPIQIDFQKVKGIKSILNLLRGSEPTIVSLLGNTLSNFDDDFELLKSLSNLLTDDDFLLIELAKVKQINADAKTRALFQYKQKAFKEFALSALIQVTNLEKEDSRFKLSVEEEELTSGTDSLTSTGVSALKIPSYYENTNKETMVVHLPDGEPMNFPAGDKIRIYLSRKYTDDGLNALLKFAKLERYANSQSEPDRWRSAEFGFELLLLKKA